MKGKILENKNTRPSYKEDNLDYDMAFSKSFRDKVCSCIIINVNHYFNILIFFREYLCILIINTALVI